MGGWQGWRGQTKRPTEQDERSRGEKVGSSQLEKHLAQRISTRGWGVGRGTALILLQRLRALSQGALLVWAALAHRS